MTPLTVEQMQWVESRPPRVKRIVLRYPPNQCYKATDNPGHYTIYSYSEPLTKRGRITVKLIHGRDSYLPGVMVYGVHPTTLIPCDCGKWKAPTLAQIKRTKLELADGQETN